MPKKTEEKIQVHKKRVIRGIHKPMLIDGGKGKKMKNVVLFRILSISGGKEKKLTE